MKIAYYPGCTLKGKAKNLEAPALAVAPKLGLELVELERWNCCGTVFSLASDDLMRQVAPIRVLVRAQELGFNVLTTLCSMCYNTVKRANQLVVSDPEKLKVLNDFMDREQDYKGKVKVLHFLEVLRDYVGFNRISSKVSTPLKLKLATYYGCLLVRPKSVAIDNPSNPQIMEDLIRALGAEPVETPSKTTCCGSYLTLYKKELVVERVKEIVEMAALKGAEAIVTSCPLCFYNLDSKQEEISRLNPSFKPMPILYFTQVLALALGEPNSCMFELHRINPVELLKSKEVLK